MLRTFFSLAVLLWLPLQAVADDHPVVIELYTSQGCSSCPPADAYLAELGAQDDTIALALHVDYWDYIGWPDRFANPGHTVRQQGFAQAGGWNMIYTPQMIIHGTAVAVGSRKSEVQAALSQARAQVPTVGLALSLSGDMLSIDARALQGPVGAADIHIVRYIPEARVDIEGGENAGRSARYTHIVSEWDVAARWNGEGRFSTNVPVMDDAPVVVLVQKPNHGPILAAARLR